MPTTWVPCPLPRSVLLTEERELLVGIDVEADARADRADHRGHQALDQRQRQPIHRLHGEAERLEGVHLGRRGNGVEGDDRPVVGGAVGEETVEDACRTRRRSDW